MKSRVTSFIILTCLLDACAPSTKITASWKNPEVNSDAISSVLVTALTDKTSNRRIVESDLADAFQQAGLRVMKSIDVLPPSFTGTSLPDRKDLADKIKSVGVDGILTVALIDKETENRYVPGSYGYTPMTRFAYYGRFWGYYTTWHPTLYSPGYYKEDKTYFLETNLYNATTEELVWSAQSETYNPNSLTGFSKEFAQIVFAKLQKDGLIKTVKI
jgi:hypothetical protein